MEHLVALARSGSNSDDNCVVCCKAMNALLGSMSLKEKIKVVLNQNGKFKCPNGTPKKEKATSPVAAPAQPGPHPSKNVLPAILENLKSRGSARPKKTKTLASTITLGLKLSDQEITTAIEQLKSLGKSSSPVRR